MDLLKPREEEKGIRERKVCLPRRWKKKERGGEGNAICRLLLSLSLLEARETTVSTLLLHALASSYWLLFCAKVKTILFRFY